MMMTIVIIIEITIRERVILLIIWTWKKKSYIISNHSFSIASYFTNRTKVFDKITTKIHTQVISFTCTWKASTNEYVSKWKGNSRDLDSDVHVEKEKNTFAYILKCVQSNRSSFLYYYPFFQENSPLVWHIHAAAITILKKK